MPKPLVNLDDLAFDDLEDNGFYTSRRALFSASIGAQKLGYNLTELPPGKSQCPFHAHREEEEMFLILEGEGELRFGAQRYPLRRHDVVRLRFIIHPRNPETGLRRPATDSRLGHSVG